MSHITNFGSCPLQRGYVAKFGRNLQNLDSSSFPVDIGRMFLRTVFKLHQDFKASVHRKEFSSVTAVTNSNISKVLKR